MLSNKFQDSRDRDLFVWDECRRHETFFDQSKPSSRRTIYIREWNWKETTRRKAFRHKSTIIATFADETLLNAFEIRFWRFRKRNQQESRRKIGRKSSNIPHLNVSQELDRFLLLSLAAATDDRLEGETAGNATVLVVHELARHLKFEDRGLCFIKGLFLERNVR